MKSGQVWTGAAPHPYLTKPRPLMVVQRLSIVSDSIVVCPLTRFSMGSPLLRVEISRWRETGFRDPSFVMVEKLTAIPTVRLRHLVGVADSDVLADIRTSLAVLLGIHPGRSVTSNPET